MIFSDLSLPMCGLAAGQAVKKLIKPGPVVFDSGVGQFMQENVIDQVVGEFHQVEIQADVILSGAASPV